MSVCGEVSCEPEVKIGDTRTGHSRPIVIFSSKDHEEPHALYAASGI